FPLYVSRFLSSYAGSLSLVILLIFFYYFALILLLGAEVNAFFSQGIKITPTNLVNMVHITTSHLPKTPEEKERQAAASHKDEPIGNVAKKAHIDNAAGKKKQQYNTQAEIAAITTIQEPDTDKKSKYTTKVVDEVPHVQVERPKGNSKVATILEAVAGTALAFVVELLRPRKK
ncbi:MAG: hypothetical protein M3Z24_01120, partial [Chloroflexota bacterium]|nr:hypothetical protein [Chloroflexota bacterium]